MKVENLFFGYLGNGLTVASNKTLAHISSDGSTISYYDKRLPTDVKNEIEKQAKEIALPVAVSNWLKKTYGLHYTIPMIPIDKKPSNIRLYTELFWEGCTVYHKFGINPVTNERWMQFFIEKY